MDFSYQQLLNKTSDIYLKQYNIPSREEISNIASLIINVEEKLENLDEKVEDELFDHSLAKEVNQLKTSISKLEKKMDQFVTIALQTRKGTKVKLIFKKKPAINKGVVG